MLLDQRQKLQKSKKSFKSTWLTNYGNENNSKNNIQLKQWQMDVLERHHDLSLKHEDLRKMLVVFTQLHHKQIQIKIYKIFRKPQNFIKQNPGNFSVRISFEDDTTKSF